MADSNSSQFAQWPGLQKSIDSDVESHDGRETRLLSYIYAHPSLSEIRGSPTAILAAMDEFAAQQDFLINIGADKARIFAKLIAKEKPRTFVEIGGYVGYSAIVVGDAMRRCWADDTAADIRVWSIELDPLCASIAMNFIDLAGLSDIVKVVVGSADDSITRLHREKALSPRPDMWLLDHDEDRYVVEFNLLRELGLLEIGVIVLADNVVRPGAPEYRALVRGIEGIDSRGIKALITPGNFEDELEISRMLKSL